jgi:hypothetical protein
MSLNNKSIFDIPLGEAQQMFNETSMVTELPYQDYHY